jgi:putative FmdB family regulatory protein
MPIYEYECLDCGKTFETFQKISDEPVKECRFCKGPVNRLVSLCSFQLKGAGWYVTDYKGSSSSGNGVKDGEKKSETTETKTETKAEEKQTSKTGAAQTHTAGTT